MKIAIVLGNRMNNDGTISKIMKKRLLITLDMYKMMKPDFIICSGGIANPIAGISEASKMKEFLTLSGIDEKIIIEEDSSMTTRENAVYSCDIAKKLQADTIIVVSSVDHFTKYPYNVIGYFNQELDESGINLLTFTKTEK